jgi:hypothetical protein
MAHAVLTHSKNIGTEVGTELYNGLSTGNTVATLTKTIAERTLWTKRYLHEFNLTRTPQCKCGLGKGTVEHYLQESRMHNDQRKKLRTKVGPVRTKAEEPLGHPELIEQTMEYVASTKGSQILRDNGGKEIKKADGMDVHKFTMLLDARMQSSL